MIEKIIKKIYYEKYTKKSYSYSHVDLVVDKMFSKINKGFYIDIGCNHPIKFNNTYTLYKRGWRGINIDLDKTSIKEFNKLRKEDCNIQALVSSEENIDKKIYYYHDRSAINTVSKKLIDYRKSKDGDFKIKNQKTKTLNNIIENSRFKNEKINILSIDVEDHEYDVLKNFNFKKYDVDCIIAEVHDYTHEKLEIYNHNIDSIINDKLYKLLVENNYKLINWINADLIFVKNEFKL